MPTATPGEPLNEETGLDFYRWQQEAEQESPDSWRFLHTFADKIGVRLLVREYLHEPLETIGMAPCAGGGLLTVSDSVAYEAAAAGERRQ